MAYGIDVSRIQATLNYRKLPDDDFVIVKLGGANVAPIYTSATAKAQVKAARAAGKKIGLYWVTGGPSPIAEQARYAAAAAKQVGYRNGDLIVLDNEALDSHGRIWNDGESAAWFTAIRTALGCDYRNLALYGSSGSLFRPRTWPQIKKLGVLIWVAAYGKNDGTRVTPDMGSTGLKPTIHQYTSNYRQQGMSLDRNWTALPVGQIFRSYKPAKPAVEPTTGGPMRSIVAASKKMQSKAQRLRDGASWTGLCAAFVYRFTGSKISYLSANLAYHDSKIISLDADAAPAGAVHFWTDPTFGHTSVALGGKRTAMASKWLADHALEHWGVNSGVADINAYNTTHPTLKYRGWAPAYGRNTMMAGLIIVAQVPGDPRLWRITENTRHHLTPAEWRPLRKKGVRPKPTTTALLAQFRVA